MEEKKTKVATTALILTLTITAMLLALPIVQSEVMLEQPMFIFVGAAPSPVGVGQPIALVYWTSEMPMPGDDDSLYQTDGREHWRGVTLTVTKPDGTDETFELGPSDPVGGGYYIYTPDMTGTYSVVASMPGQWRNRTAVIPWGASKWVALGAGDYYFGPATSDSTEFVVQEEQLPSWPAAELPTEYWTRPIEAGLREWTTIAGNWLNDGMGNPYTTGPETSHMMWTRPLFFGGVAGEPFGTIDIYEGTSYQGKWSGAVVMLGRLYYNQPLGDSSTSSHRKVVCVDLRTGEQLWEVNGTSISYGMMYEYWSRNQHGVHPYLWTYDNRILDPFSGSELFRYTNVPFGTSAVGPNGERLIYVFGGYPLDRTWLALWNSTAMISMRGSTIIPSTGYDQWRPVGKVHNGTDGYVWNVTLPPGLGTGPNIYALEDRIISGPGRTTGYLETYHIGFLPFGYAAPHGNFSMWAVSTAEDSRGELLWNVPIELPAPNVTMQWSSVSLEEGVVILRAKETRQFIAYDIDTGEKLWTTEPQNSWMMYSSGSQAVDGILYSGGYGGTLYAYDIDNGELLWTATTDPCGLEGPYDRWPISGFEIIDGKIYVRTGEHSHTHPLNRGWSMYCFDAKTGEPIWNTTGIWYGSQCFADGYIVSLNLMDIQIYCFGKGPTATTVSASPSVVADGSSVIIQGMVTDESAGTKSDALTARFPHGVPAIADEDMTRWMDYVYKQHAMPMDVKGVEVILETLDPNDNYYEIGRVTTDATGMFKLMWEPPVEGDYTIVASFAGSESYWKSTAETAIGVTEAPSPGIEPTTEPPTTAPPTTAPPTTAPPTTAPPTTAPPPTGEAPLITTETAIAISVAIAAVIGIAAYWAFRRRQIK
jgi:outer membrane protein assembly factor BamB